MAQSYVLPAGTDTLTASRTTINNALEALKTNFSGTAFPTVNVAVGQTCYRTDVSGVYMLRSTGPDTWVLIFTLTKTAIHQEDADGRYVRLATASTMSAKLTLTNELEIQYTQPNIWMHSPSQYRMRIWLTSDAYWRLRNDGASDDRFRVGNGGDVWTPQIGDLNTRIEQRAAAYAAGPQGTANAAVDLANARVHRCQLSGYGEIGGTGGMNNVAPSVFTGAGGTAYGAAAFGYRTLQMYLPDAGGWNNFWVS